MRRWYLLFFLCVFSFSSFCQDAEYSQFYANPLYLNPAFTGTTEYPRFSVNYRNQWPGLGNTFVNYSVSFDRYYKALNGGLGFQLSNNSEAEGRITSSSAFLFYSHHIKVNDHFFIDAAMQAGGTYKGFNKSGLVFPSEINELNGVIIPDGSMNIEDASKVYPDFGIGLLGQSGSCFFGFSIHHLTKPDESLIAGDQKGYLPRKITINVGARTKKLRNGLLSKPYTLSPNIIYQQQGSFRQMNLGMYLNIGPLAGGLWYRNNLSIRPDAVIAMIGIMREKFKIGYSYDLSLSSLSNYSFSSHELSLIYFLGERIKSNTRKAMIIPEF
ncbi:MAG: hypothetical protein A2W90_04350 [Bacteroidetes bacterium GWF2_42_66]|nr:MAG: hypothetical protein A2W92_21190 [Bacteroidetes bacterium GWA2_42_15]OFY02453.1 MAG: hypothetical protein A2W89_21505 [Bacteroidetes bacterium GWE2_42_39]OFY41448.1 MAG: hypothetical protein A2W90_04350 [Bacteroidetes bacterium GWF2_42_66]